MRCPFCSSLSNKVVDKRSVLVSGDIRRRRECLSCKKRFTTYERLADLELIVLKRDGRREVFSREKLRAGISKALEKRPNANSIDQIADKIEKYVRKRGDHEIASKLIGRMVLTELKKIDGVAYLRFVSVYRQFKHVEDFAKELEHLSDFN